ncbi:selT protein-like [Tropilaelaps mercedesae]|uniref:SelT protein-like n=1 Tax=Tropilaelaps mercedesae TaxID=418985 RepID=A0A1V9XXV7_9ACAR|nr:selT protein-like [Tropilaelaps mercedesae]
MHIRDKCERAPIFSKRDEVVNEKVVHHTGYRRITKSYEDKINISLYISLYKQPLFHDVTRICAELLSNPCLRCSRSKGNPKASHTSRTECAAGTYASDRLLVLSTSGYHRALQQYISLLSEKYQGQVLARGEAFQHAAWAHYVSYALTSLKLALAGLLLFKVNILSRLQSRYPRVVEFTINNRMLVTISVFLLISTLEAKLTSTGHFEIYYNDVPVWSKLASGRFPSPGELFQIIDHQILIKNTPRISL